jgi:hypothetical protein
VTALQVLLEFQRDWARTAHYDEVMATLKAHCSIYRTATISNQNEQNLKK